MNIFKKIYQKIEVIRMQAKYAYDSNSMVFRISMVKMDGYNSSQSMVAVGLTEEERGMARSIGDRWCVKLEVFDSINKTYLPQCDIVPPITKNGAPPVKRRCYYSRYFLVIFFRAISMMAEQWFKHYKYYFYSIFTKMK